MHRARLSIALIAGCLFLRAAASAQLVLGQYEDEAPLATWNSFGAPAAASTGLGGAQLTLAWDASASLANPAILIRLPRLSASLAGSYAGASMFRYALVNTGVVTTAGTPSVAVFGIDQASAAYRGGPWAFAFAAAVPECYARPAIAAEDGGYRLTFRQSGYLRLFHAGIARRLTAGLSVGMGISYAAGRLDRTTIETDDDGLRVVTITDDRSERYRGIVLNAGLAWEASSRLTFAAAVRSPYLKKGRATSLLRYEVPSAGTDIRTDASATNTYRQPWAFGTGVSFRLSESWSLAADALYFAWSGYRVTYFDEPRDRPFRDVVRAGAGVEYLAPAGRIYGGAARIPFRFGVSFDPQPMTTVRSAYWALTFGTGLELEALAVDVSAAFGRESGTGQSLRSGRIVVSVRYIFRE